MNDKRRDYLMLQGMALMAARFLAYLRARGQSAMKKDGMRRRSYEQAMLCLAIAASNLEEAANRLLDIPKRRKGYGNHATAE